MSQAPSGGSAALSTGPSSVGSRMAHQPVRDKGEGAVTPVLKKACMSFPLMSHWP